MYLQRRIEEKRAHFIPKLYNEKTLSNLFFIPAEAKRHC